MSKLDVGLGRGERYRKEKETLASSTWSEEENIILERKYVEETLAYKLSTLQKKFLFLKQFFFWVQRRISSEGLEV